MSRLATWDILDLIPTACFVCGIETTEGDAYPGGFRWRHWKCRPSDSRRRADGRGR